MLKFCLKCQVEKKTTAFYKNARTADGRTSYCIDCQKAEVKANRKKEKATKQRKHANAKEMAKSHYNKTRNRNRVFVWEYLAENGCETCGETNPITLDFDHLVPANKKASIASMVCSSSIERLQTEMDKCRILCSNCHRKHTAKQQDFYRYLRFEAAISGVEYKKIVDNGLF